MAHRIFGIEKEIHIVEVPYIQYLRCRRFFARYISSDLVCSSAIFCFLAGNVTSLPRSEAVSGGKYLRGHLYACSSSSTSTPSNSQKAAARPNTTKVRVLSILDKIRSSTQENYPAGLSANTSGANPAGSTSTNRPSSMNSAQTNNEALIDAISLVEDNG